MLWTCYMDGPSMRNQSDSNSIRRSVNRALILSLCISSLALAQEARVQPGEDATFKVRSNYVMAPVTVLDKAGKPFTGLTVLDFRLYDNGKLQTITEDVATHPISLVVAIQSNAS